MVFREGQMVRARFQVCTASAMPGLQAKPLPPASVVNMDGNDGNCTNNGDNNGDDDDNDNTNIGIGIANSNDDVDK